MELDGIQSVINHLLNHNLNGFQKLNATVISSSFQNKDDYDPKKLAREDAVGPGCLDQMGKDSPIIPIAKSSLAIRVFLLLYTPEPVFYVLSAHSEAPAAWPFESLLVASHISLSNGASLLISIGL
jgi:hypothetical protein